MTLSGVSGSMADLDKQLDGATIVQLPGQEASIRATPYVWRDASLLPRQQFLYGFELQRGHVSALVAPGAAGKSTYLMARALCMATGIRRFKQQVWNGPHRVWLWNLEDKRVHLERMLQAFCMHHGIKEADLGDRLFLDSAVRNADGEGDYVPQVLKLATEDRSSGVVIQRPHAQALISELRARAIDHLDVDPFVSSHGVSENDNNAIDLVAKEWAYIAAEANCSISLAHHIKKIEGREATALDARGATALINAARSVLVINRMDAEQADACGIAHNERKFYFNMVDGKSNRAPPARSADWFKLVGQGLGNADVGCPGPEDNVAAVERFIPPDAFGGLSKDMLRYVMAQIEGNPSQCREHIASPQWVGRVVADALSLSIDLPADKNKVQLFVRTWLQNGLLRTVLRNVRGEQKKFVEVAREIERE